MSQRLYVFMKGWVSENVKAQGHPPKDRIDPEAAQLARRFVIDAQAQGITEQELEAEFGSLPFFMHAELERAVDEEIGRKKAKRGC